MKTVKSELTKKEAADLLGVPSRTIERRLKPARQPSGEHGFVSMYRRADVLRLAEEVGRPVTAPGRHWSGARRMSRSPPSVSAQATHSTRPRCKAG